MLRLTVKSLLANKVRFALTTFGVILAVSFVVSAFVLGDGLRSTFGGIAEESVAGVDLEVRPVTDFGVPPPLPEDLTEVVAGVDGVADARPTIDAGWDVVQILDDEGRPINAGGGPPQIATGWVDNDQLNAFHLVDGRPPGPGEFVVDIGSAAEHDLTIGDTYQLTSPTGPASLTMSGTSSFGAENGTAGAVLFQVNAAEAAGLFGIDGIDTVIVELDDEADPVATQAAVEAAVQAVAPGTEVVDNAVVTAEQIDFFTADIDIIGSILLGFGGVSLFVSIFIIYNTFAIVLSQRTRELALLRTIGADTGQIRRSVLAEALAVGLLASAGGLAGGVGLATGLEALFNEAGASLPDTPTIIAARTVLAAIGIGLGVTMVAATGPARRAGSVPAIAALRGDVDTAPAQLRARLVAGATLFGLGVVAGAVGLAGIGGTAATITLLSIGAIGVFLGVTLLGPFAVAGVTRVLGWPLSAVGGVAGRLAQENASRNPRRTATTAAALMIGLALVSTAMIVGQSIKESIGSTLETSATADYFLTDQLDDARFPLTVAAELQADEAVDAVSGFRYSETRVDGVVGINATADLAQLPPLLDLDVREGGGGPTVEHPALIAARRAETSGLGVGDIVVTEFASGATVAATITGVFHDEAIFDTDFVFDESVFEAADEATGYEWLAFSVADDAEQADVDAAIGALSSRFPAANLETTSEFIDRTAATVDSLLAMVNVMVALAVVIALIGIANTLALSIFERTRELGLVRAVGMTRRQVRRMVRFEAALVATFGAVLGVAIGLLFGWGVTVALPVGIASTVAIPVQGILVLIAVAAVAGVLAATLPARRAGRLDVLDAISR